MWWLTQGSCALPVFLVAWSSSTFIVPYVIALFRRDVDVLFPYISDTGANPPESCIFGLMTFVSACAGKRKANENGPKKRKLHLRACVPVRAGMATVYSRFKFVEKLSEAASARLNKTSLVLGMLACLGMCVVATFQETTVTAVHDIGALLFFVSGILYVLLQSVISYQAFPRSSSAAVCRARLAVAVVATLALFPTVICAFFVKQTDLHRDAGSKDYPFHMASAVCEWIVAFSFICFFLTYIDDFKLFTLRVKAELL
ncbi:DNA damage-regulated autophagy modulator protein 1 isoform X1 [Phyllopteryx taeniolatus]|uniref:DNA damage-regulated autophagy modulator protein 1 isoform X1 n=1 Tax=Phyllopteryx taeniolatus TaxID=161469 RepID=UPI002AD49AE3|nr:DNA damage-regulated autophagy modulator protein 1 isoform X1 [Phyllopteryx taeniolatus]